MRIIFSLFVFILLAGCSAKPSVVPYTHEYSGKGSNPVYVVSHGLHTGLVVPVTQVYGSIPMLAQRFGENTPYIEFGWGDKAYYPADEVTSGLTVQAVFWPTSAVLHLVAVPEDVRGYFSEGEVKAICFSDEELASLVRFIVGSFHREVGDVVMLKKGKYGDSQFYHAVGDYYLMSTCNMRTAKGLKSAGMDISPTFKFSAASVIDALEDSGAVSSRCQP